MKNNILRFHIPGPPVGLEHEGGRKGGGRRTETKSRAYMDLCATYAMKAICDHRAQGQWPYEKDVYMDVEIYNVRESPRPDPENVIAILQDGFTPKLWKNDRNVLGRPMKHWWPGKDKTHPPAVLFENGRYSGKYLGGVLILVRKL